MLNWQPMEEYAGGLAIFYYPRLSERGGFTLGVMYRVDKGKPLIPRQPTMFAGFNEPSAAREEK